MTRLSREELLARFREPERPQLSSSYEQDRVLAIKEGEQRVVENLLRVRFGSLDDELLAIIEPLLALTPEEFTPLIVQLSREELLARFSQQE